MRFQIADSQIVSALKSNEYFGQYGKIARLYLRDRPPIHTSSATDPADITQFGFYVVYVRREDASRAIFRLDSLSIHPGAQEPSLRATYGTMRYCDAFLRQTKCDNANCHALHEWAGESDTFTKEDMQIAVTKPAEYDARQKALLQAASATASRNTNLPRSSVLDHVAASISALPNSAAWGKGPVTNGRVTPISARTAKMSAEPAATKSNPVFPISSTSNAASSANGGRQSGVSMSRNRSQDSSSNSATTSSQQTSPTKRSSALPSLLRAAPPLVNDDFAKLNGGPMANGHTSVSDAEESISAGSEAGPSTSSPTPETPSRSNAPAPPLNDDPIVIHSPYDEPSNYPFPSLDPDFAYEPFPTPVDTHKVDQDYTPTPFNQTLLQLASLGVLSPRLPDRHRPETKSFLSFQPFDPTPASPPADEPVEQERTGTRFDFAKMPDRSIVRSPVTSLQRPMEVLSSSREWQHSPHGSDGWGVQLSSGRGARDAFTGKARDREEYHRSELFQPCREKSH